MATFDRLHSRSAFPETDPLVAYFSMEIAIHPAMPTYSGGLGVLAGDTLRSAADLGVHLVAVTLVHNKGYFKQTIDANGLQHEQDQPWSAQEFCTEELPRVTVIVEGRPVVLRAWRYDLTGINGHIIPIYLLDSDLEENDPRDRSLTDHLYGGDTNYRLAQETILGIGGAQMLGALGLDVGVYHQNEGHAALLALYLLERQVGSRTLESTTERDVAAVRELCVFTTHTPVPAGHDRFTPEQSSRILGQSRADVLEHLGCHHEGLLNVTYIALRFSRYVNGVALQHGKVSREMFPQYRINSITNGVHARTWTSEPFTELFSATIPNWRQDNLQLRNLFEVPATQIAACHAEAKHALFEEIKRRAGFELNPSLLTLGFARRAATYKRADMLFTDPERLLAIAKKSGGIQILYGGKAHPADDPGKAIIHNVIEKAKQYSNELLQIHYIENYDWELGALLTSGVDVWLNTPRRPYEASGTSGMKAALNGVPSLSILDGWWIEGCIEGVTGWAIEDGDSDDAEAQNLYRKLEAAVVPLYANREGWANLMRTTIVFNGSFFNTNRMVEQYVRNAYFPINDGECEESLEAVAD
jgi:starch phosphorylase